MPKTIKELEEFCDYIAEHAHDIPIRAKFHGKWNTYTLDGLPTKSAIRHALQLVKEEIHKLNQPQFFLHAGSGSIPFDNLEAAKISGRLYPTGAYIAALNGAIVWEKSKTGKETDHEPL